jgi:hypothetical protein
MNGCRVKYWGVAAGWVLACAGAAAAQPAISPPSAPQPSPVTTAAIAGAEARAPYPSFASIPAFPKDVRSVAAWKASVISIKAEGADLVRLIAAEPWTLNNTEAWAADERAIATPPPPVAVGGDTEAFVAAMRERATPPPPLHHTAGAQPASHP